MPRIVKLLALTVAMAGLVACGRPVPVGVGGPSVPTGQPEIMPAWTSCAEHAGQQQPFGGAEAVELPRLGADFTPTAAVVCDMAPQARPDAGTDLVATERRTDGVTALVAALRLPDQPRADQSCTMELLIVPWFAVLDATGRWVRPGVPVDGCGKIRIEVRKAISALDLSTVSSRTVRTLETPEAVKAGCGQEWADIVAAETFDKAVKAGAYAVEVDSAAGVRLCVYRVPADQQGTGKPAGNFEYGGVLDPQRWSSIEQGLRAAGPVRDCTQHAGRFALLRSATGAGGEVYVELDGCQRITTTPFNAPPGFAQAGAELLRLLIR
jgi:hypothetical protein